ncbi:MAG: hypothetical protein ABI379_03070 [Rhodanobacter sp.]
MKKSWLWLLLLVLLAIIIGLLLSRCGNSGAEAGEGCGPGTHNGDCEAVVKVGEPVLSIWSDGTISLAIPIENQGGRGAGDVEVTKLAFGAGHRIGPASLPVPVGEIAPGARGVVQAQFNALTVPGSDALTVSGTFVDRGKTRPFATTISLALRAPDSSPVPTAGGTLSKHKTSGIPGKPVPIRPEVDGLNKVGPPIPLGPGVHPFTVMPTSTPVDKAPPPGGTAGGITFVRDTAFANSITNAPPDPSTGADWSSSSGVVVDTENTLMRYSTDAGQNFTDVDPTTIFPASDGGICCDQVVVYDPNHDLIFWLQQYAAGSGAGATNRLRIAWASPASIKANANSWTYLDLTQPGFNSAGGLDYPDLALNGTYLFVSVDGSDSSGKTSGLIVTRLSLADIVGGGSSVGFSYVGPNESTDMNRAHGSHLSQSSADGIYWAGSVDSSNLEVFHWSDGPGSVNRHQTAINQWCGAAADYTNLAPDNQQWPDTGHLGGAGNIVGVTRSSGFGGGHGTVWFAWGAGADNSTDCPKQSGRPLPFVKIVKIDDNTLDATGEYDIWNSAYAFSYPALATDPSGNVGVSVAFAGPGNYPSSTVGYLGDYVVYYVEASTVSLKFYLNAAKGYFTFTNPGDGSLVSDSSGNPIVYTRYGDYFSVRNSGSNGTLFSSLGYAVSAVDSTKSTSCLTPPGCTYHPHYQQWGRPTPPPPR